MQPLSLHPCASMSAGGEVPPEGARGLGPSLPVTKTPTTPTSWEPVMSHTFPEAVLSQDPVFPPPSPFPTCTASGRSQVLARRGEGVCQSALSLSWLLQHQCHLLRPACHIHSLWHGSGGPSSSPATRHPETLVLCHPGLPQGGWKLAPLGRNPIWSLEPDFSRNQKGSLTDTRTPRGRGPGLPLGSKKPLSPSLVPPPGGQEPQAHSEFGAEVAGTPTCHPGHRRLRSSARTSTSGGAQDGGHFPQGGHPPDQSEQTICVSPSSSKLHYSEHTHKLARELARPPPRPRAPPTSPQSLSRLSPI